MAEREFQRAEIQGKWDELEPLFEKHGLNPDYCIGRLKEIINLPITVTKRNKAGDEWQETDPHAGKIVTKALELWAKLSGYRPPERIFVNPLNGLILKIDGETE